jgi:hypothetical protein
MADSDHDQTVSKALEHLRALNDLLPSLRGLVSTENEIKLAQVVQSVRAELDEHDSSIPEGILFDLVYEDGYREYRVLPATDDLIAYLYAHARRKSRPALNDQLVAFCPQSRALTNDPVEQSDSVGYGLDLSQHVFDDDIEALISAKAVALHEYARPVYDLGLGFRFIFDSITRDRWRVIREPIVINLTGLL